jgi:hypothetical protein
MEGAATAGSIDARRVFALAVHAVLEQLRHFLPKPLLGDAQLRAVILVALRGERVANLDCARRRIFVAGLLEPCRIALGEGWASGDGPAAGVGRCASVVSIV